MGGTTAAAVARTSGRGAARARRRVALAVAAALLAVACREPHPRLDFTNREESVYAFLSEGTRAAADQLLEDRWDLGKRFPSPTVIEHVSWTEDPFEDPYWRFLFYSLRPTTNLLWAYYTTGVVEYRDKLLEILQSYAAFDAARPVTPYDRARLDYPYAAAFRALVLVNTVRKLERTGDIGAELSASLRASIARLGAFLHREENFEPANHGFSEAIALAVVARNFPELPEAQAWRDTAAARVESVMRSIVDADGVEIENSPFYHYYVLGFALQFHEWARRFGVAVSPELEQSTHRMVRYATLAIQPDGFIPALGASVELGVDHLDPRVYAPLAEAFPEFGFVYTKGASGVPPRERAALFPISGQAVLRSGFGTNADDALAETHVMFNVGPWRTKHSHLDVLGITYYSNGRRLLVDSGLFTYEPGAEKDYFFGTRAHNTVAVDGADQAILGAIQAGRTTTGDRWAHQSGWHELYPGVVHRRSVLVLERDLLLVVDTLDGDAAHEYAQTWHLAPGLSIALSGLAVDARTSTGAVELALRQAYAGGVTVTTAEGATAPLQGWVSDLYGRREPAPVVEFRVTARSAGWVTLLASGSAARGAPSVAATTGADGTIRARVCGGSCPYLVVIANQAFAGEQVEVAPAAGPCP